MDKEELLLMAKQALKNWAEKNGTPEGAAAGYDVLRYAKQGFYEVIPTACPEPVTVKPLVWEKHGVEDLKANTEFGQYLCVRTLYDTSALWLGVKKLGNYGGGSHKEAKAAAQADYEARILSTITYKGESK